MASLLEAMEAMPGPRRLATKSVVVGATLALGGWWYFTYFTLPKREYNKAHPFTSFIPLFCYMVLRNMSPLLRRWHMHMFAWTGKITLETYILQFHVWMKTTGVNGSPKHLMVWLPGWYWTNFLLTTVVYIFISYRIFKITATLRDACIPKEGGAALARRGLFVSALLPAFYGMGTLLRGFVGA